MKKIIIGFLLIVCANNIHAQITIDSSKAFKVEGYAGVLLAPKIGTDSGKVSVITTARAGANMYWTPTPWFLFNGLGVVEINEKGRVTPIYILGIRLKLHDRIAVTVGKIPSPMTELRPVPTTQWGQFETWTSAQILPSAIGGKATITINKESRIVAGVLWRPNDVSIELSTKVPHVHMGVYYQVTSRTFGGAIKVSTKYVGTTIAYNQKGNFGVNASLNIPKTDGWMLYSLAGFSTTNWKWIRGEWGVLKVFTFKKVNAVVGAGYAHDNKGVWGYLQISL